MRDDDDHYNDGSKQEVIFRFHSRKWQAEDFYAKLSAFAAPLLEKMEGGEIRLHTEENVYIGKGGAT